MAEAVQTVEAIQKATRHPKFCLSQVWAVDGNPLGRGKNSPVLTLPGEKKNGSTGHMGDMISAPFNFCEHLRRDFTFVE